MTDNPILLQETQISGRVFGDARLAKRGRRFTRRFALAQTVSIQTLAQDWSEQMGYYRFLHNEQVALGELRQSLSSHCQQQVGGRPVLAISDRSEINLSAHRGRLHPEDLGVLSNDRDVGFFVHPTLVLDAEDGFPLGLSAVHLWSRPLEHEDKHTRNYQQQAIEDKESFKWLHASEDSQPCLAAIPTGGGQSGSR